MIQKLQWKMPTWPGLIGLLGLASAVVTQVGDVGGLPNSVKVALVSVSGGLVIVERVAQAVDNAVATNGSAVSAVVSSGGSVSNSVPAISVPTVIGLSQSSNTPAGPATPPAPTVAET
jgi:hypothetical protein